MRSQGEDRGLGRDTVNVSDGRALFGTEMPTFLPGRMSIDDMGYSSIDIVERCEQRLISDDCTHASKHHKGCCWCSGENQVFEAPSCAFEDSSTYGSQNPYPPFNDPLSEFQGLEAEEPVRQPCSASPKGCRPAYDLCGWHIWDENNSDVSSNTIFSISSQGATSLFNNADGFLSELDVNRAPLVRHWCGEDLELDLSDGSDTSMLVQTRSLHGPAALGSSYSRVDDVLTSGEQAWHSSFEHSGQNQGASTFDFEDRIGLSPLQLEQVEYGDMTSAQLDFNRRNNSLYQKNGRLDQDDFPEPEVCHQDSSSTASEFRYDEGWIPSESLKLPDSEVARAYSHADSGSVQHVASLYQALNSERLDPSMAAGNSSRPKRIQPKPSGFDGSAARTDPDGKVFHISRLDNSRGRAVSRPSFPRRQRSKDTFLVRAKRAGKSYKEIRAEGNFTEAESTLRGRFRTLTKEKDRRVRKPQWETKDIQLLAEAVRTFTEELDGGIWGMRSFATSGSSKKPLKMPWKKVAGYIAQHGGSYHFGNATCKKKWDDMCGEGYVE
ncbi:MAG: hypothetical protein M1833_004498 [Piccolia ochrophora]|nr:MAG: hypothetical protein M1833_004498 [Piccolia ochrophora]